MVITINRMKAMIELRKLDEGIQKEKSEGKTQWTDQEIAFIEEKRKVLDAIIETGKGEYDEEKYGAVEYGFSNTRQQEGSE